MIFAPFLPFSSQKLHELLGYEGCIAGPLEFREIEEEGEDAHDDPHGRLRELDRRAGSRASSPLGRTCGSPSRSSESSTPSIVADELARLTETRDRHARAPRRARGCRSSSRAGAWRRRNQDHLDRHRSDLLAPRALDLIEAHDGRLRRRRSSIPTRRAPHVRSSRLYRALLRHPKVVGLGGDRPRLLTATTRRATRSGEALHLPARLARTRRSRRRDPHTARRTRTRLAILRQWFDGTVVLHCFSSPALLDEALEQGWYVSFAGNVTYPKRGRSARRGARRPADRLLAETDCPYLAPQPVRGKTNEPAYVVHTARGARRGARRRLGRALGAQIDANATAAFGSAMSVRREEAARPALPRRREHPRRDRPPRRARRRRRRARGRARARRADAVPRRSRRSGVRSRAGHVLSSELTGRLGSTLERRASLRRRAQARPRRDRARGDEARRQPAVQHRDAARRRSLDRLPEIGLWMS